MYIVNNMSNSTVCTEFRTPYETEWTLLANAILTTKLLSDIFGLNILTMIYIFPTFWINLSCEVFKRSILLFTVPWEHRQKVKVILCNKVWLIFSEDITNNDVKDLRLTKVSEKEIEKYETNRITTVYNSVQYQNILKNNNKKIRN